MKTFEALLVTFMFIMVATAVSHQKGEIKALEQRIERLESRPILAPTPTPRVAPKAEVEA